MQFIDLSDVQMIARLWAAEYRVFPLLGSRVSWRWIAVPMSL